MSSGSFLSHHTNTGLVLSTDGVPIFKSSKGSLWPVYLMVTSIPPHLRTKVENLIIASLWFGPTKPDMNCMLHPIMESLSHLNRNGVAVNEKVTIRCKLLIGVFDLPAKAAATNTKQFNGEYGCFYCLDKGHLYNRARIYPPSDPHILRTNQQMKIWASNAEKSKIPEYGVKGPSILSSQLEFPQCIPIDYMHCILEGVFKNLMKYWFGSSFHSEPFSLRRHASTINAILSKIRPPTEIYRLPRSTDQLSFFKANEYRAWLLFYSLPVLSEFLPDTYSRHLSSLVSAMHILLSDKILRSDLDIAYRMLSSFYETAGKLYSHSIYTINMHSLEHIVPFVELWGPLWGYSMFCFENLNGYLGTTYHGKQKILPQMAFQIQLSQTVPDKLRQLSLTESAETAAYLSKILSNNRGMQAIDTNCYSIGKISRHTISDEEITIASNHGIFLSSNDVETFHRLMLRSTIYCTLQYQMRKRRNNAICCYNLSGNIAYGKIEAFYLPKNAIPFCIINQFSYLVNTELSTPFVRIATNCTSTQVAIPLTNILRKCILVNVQQQSYVIPFPNSYEVH